MRCRWCSSELGLPGSLFRGVALYEKHVPWHCIELKVKGHGRLRFSYPVEAQEKISRRSSFSFINRRLRMFSQSPTNRRGSTARPKRVVKSSPTPVLWLQLILLLHLKQVGERTWSSINFGFLWVFQVSVWVSKMVRNACLLNMHFGLFYIGSCPPLVLRGQNAVMRMKCRRRFGSQNFYW